MTFWHTHPNLTLSYRKKKKYCCRGKLGHEKKRWHDNIWNLLYVLMSCPLYSVWKHSTARVLRNGRFISLSLLCVSCLGAFIDRFCCDVLTYFAVIVWFTNNLCPHLYNVSLIFVLPQRLTTLYWCYFVTVMKKQHQEIYQSHAFAIFSLFLSAIRYKCLSVA